VAIVNDAAEVVTPPTQPPEPKPEARQPGQGDQPTTHGDVAPRAPNASTRFLASAVESELERVQSWLRDYARRNPGAEIEVIWRVVAGGQSG
jgi:hypothetical protein